MGLISTTTTAYPNGCLMANGYPLDARLVVDSLSALTATATWSANGNYTNVYPGMLVYVVEDHKTYKFTGTSEEANAKDVADKTKWKVMDPEPVNGNYLALSGGNMSGDVTFSTGRTITVSSGSQRSVFSGIYIQTTANGGSFSAIYPTKKSGSTAASSGTILTTADVDNSLNTGSTNPVSNKTVAAAIEKVTGSVTGLTDTYISGGTISDGTLSLKYNNSEKTGVTITGVASTAWAEKNCVVKTGDTMTGGLTIQSKTAGLKLSSGAPGDKTYKFTYSGITEGEDTVIKYPTKSGTLLVNSNVDSSLTTGSTNPVQNAAVTKVILDNEKTTSAALNNLKDLIDTLQTDLNIIDCGEYTGTDS